MSTTAPSEVRYRVNLPGPLAEAYEQQAARAGLDVEEFLSLLLTKSNVIDYQSEKPLHFSDADRRELERALGRNVKNSQDALKIIQAAMSVRVAGKNIPLNVGLLAKLKSRAIGVPFEKFLERLVVEDLERHVGIR